MGKRGPGTRLVSSSETGYELVHRRFACPLARTFLLTNLPVVPGMLEIQNRLQNCTAFHCLLEVQH